MGFLLSGRSALAVFLLSLALIGAVRLVEAPIPTRTVTEIVSVMQLPERPAPAQAAPPDQQPVEAAAPVREEPPRVVVAIARPTAPVKRPQQRPHAIQVVRAPDVKPAPSAAVKAVVAQAGPPVPRMFVPLRRLGMDIRVRLARAGIVPSCGDAQCDADGATR